jgi:hypothetical protein
MSIVDRQISPTGLITDIGFEDGKMHVHYSQNQNPLHELNQLQRNDDQMTRDGIKNDLWKVGSLSEVDCMRLITEDGIDPYTANTKDLFKHLRRHKDKWGHVFTTRGRF